MLEVTDTTIKQFNYKLAVFICDSESETDANAGPEPTLTWVSNWQPEPDKIGIIKRWRRSWMIQNYMILIESFCLPIERLNFPSNGMGG